MSADRAGPRVEIVCDQVVVGYGPSTGPDTGITSLPARMVTGFDPDNGPPWQLIGDTAAMHLLLLGSDDDALRPSLGRGPATEPWPSNTATHTRDTEPNPPSLTIARARSARGLHAGQGVGSQLILAHGHLAGDHDDQYLFALTRDITAGSINAYTHHVGKEHWMHHVMPSHRWVSSIYQHWPEALWDPHDAATELRHTLTTNAFGEKLKHSLGVVMSQTAGARASGSVRRIRLPRAQKALAGSWLSSCDQHANEALANGVEPMLEIYLTRMAHEATPAWAMLCHMIDRLQGLPRTDQPEVSGEDWSPYGDERAHVADRLVHSMPRRIETPLAPGDLFHTMQTGRNSPLLRSQAQLNPLDVRQRRWDRPIVPGTGESARAQHSGPGNRRVSRRRP